MGRLSLLRLWPQRQRESDEGAQDGAQSKTAEINKRGSGIFGRTDAKPGLQRLFSFNKNRDVAVEAGVEVADTRRSTSDIRKNEWERRHFLSIWNGSPSRTLTPRSSCSPAVSHDTDAWSRTSPRSPKSRMASLDSVTPLYKEHRAQTAPIEEDEPEPAFIETRSRFGRSTSEPHTSPSRIAARRHTNMPSYGRTFTGSSLGMAPQYWLAMELPEDNFVASRSYRTHSTIASDIMANSHLEIRKPASMDIRKLLLKRVTERDMYRRTRDDFDSDDEPEAHLDGSMLPGALQVESLTQQPMKGSPPQVEEA